jgi:cell division protein ZapA (FtsZ GTPase activity inhibitor)
MDEKLKIKISIADRVYPTVELSQEEGLRSASKKIDVMMSNLKKIMQGQTRCISHVRFAICFSSRTKTN